MNPKTLFCADLHLGHAATPKFRPFDSVEEHDGVIVENILSCGSAKNSLWLLGDCFFTRESLDALRKFRTNYKHIHFVLGNHDTDSMVRQENIRIILAENLVDKVYGFTNYKEFLVSHCPIHPDEMRNYKGVIHGHIHDREIDDPRYVCVSLEHTNYKPLDFKEIRERFSGN